MSIAVIPAEPASVAGLGPAVEPVEREIEPIGVPPERERASELQAACRALLPGYAAARSETERVSLLTRACLEPAPPDGGHAAAPRAAAAFDAIRRAIGTLGHRHRFIVADAQRPSDVLCALWLARRSGLFEPPRGAPSRRPRATSILGLVPLFERRVALDRATETMGVLYSNAAYREHLWARGRHQELLLAYSDGAPERDYLASRWSLHHAQTKLDRQARERGLLLSLLHRQRDRG